MSTSPNPLASLTPLDGDERAQDRTSAARAPGRTARSARSTRSRSDRRSTESPAAAAEQPVARTRSRGIGRERVPAAVLMVFSRQLASFLEAGISVIEALEVVAAETTSPRMRAVINDMRDTVLRGGRFSDACGNHPGVFPGWYRAMVRSAEFTGRLDEVLEQLAVYLERDLGARRQVKSALTYPIFVLVVAIVGMIVMSIVVLPKFQRMYSKLGADLPMPTRILLGWTDFVATAWPLLLAGGVAVVVAAHLIFGRGEGGHRRRDRLVLRTPVIGPLYEIISVERFCRVLAALTSAGVPLPDGIEMSANSTNNTHFQSRMEPVREALVRGGGISKPMTESGVIPTAALQMIRVGERTGTLAVQLHKSAAFFEREVSYRIKKATDLFQPAVILLVGSLVGFVAIAQVAAMYSIFGQVNR